MSKRTPNPATGRDAAHAKPRKAAVEILRVLGTVEEQPQGSGRRTVDLRDDLVAMARLLRTGLAKTPTEAARMVVAPRRVPNAGPQGAEDSVWTANGRVIVERGYVNQLREAYAADGKRWERLTDDLDRQDGVLNERAKAVVQGAATCRPASRQAVTHTLARLRAADPATLLQDVDIKAERLWNGVTRDGD